MKIGVYNQPSVNGINGVEFEACTLAEALSSHHEVELVHHVPERRVEELRSFYGVDMTRVRLRYVEGSRFRPSGLPWHRYRQARSWRAECSAGYDLFFSFSASLPPFCHARRGVLRVIFPLSWQAASAPDTARERVKKLYTDWEWQRRLATYDVKLSNSEFTARWARRRRGIDCTPVPPPARVRYPLGEKEPLILSVGRFAVGGTPKCQLEMVRVFRDLRRSGLDGWRYSMVGPVGRDEASRSYAEDVRRIARTCGAVVLEGPPRAELDRCYARAAIFWHAAGYSLDEERDPDNMEHFGIVTVEAMAAGCVPLVVNKGGQPEIVEHGVNGFLWDTLDELAAYTRLLTGDAELRSRMSAAARDRARRYGPEPFVSGILEECVRTELLEAADVPPGLLESGRAA